MKRNLRLLERIPTEEDNEVVSDKVCIPSRHLIYSLEHRNTLTVSPRCLENVG